MAKGDSSPRALLCVIENGGFPGLGGLARYGSVQALMWWAVHWGFKFVMIVVKEEFSERFTEEYIFDYSERK